MAHRAPCLTLTGRPWSPKMRCVITSGATGAKGQPGAIGPPAAKTSSSSLTTATTTTTTTTPRQCVGPEGW